MLTMEICCQVLHLPVYFCDGATTPLLRYDVISAASLVIDTEARQIWSKHTVQCGHAVPFTHSSAVTPTTTESPIVNRQLFVNCCIYYCQLNRHRLINRLQRINYYINYCRSVHYYSVCCRLAIRCPVSSHHLSHA